MAENTPPAPRGDAAWRAAKAEMDKRNDAARARGAAERAAKEARTADRRLADAKREATDLPVQPRPD